MGRGEPRRNNHLKVVLLAVVGFWLLVFYHQLPTINYQLQLRCNILTY